MRDLSLLHNSLEEVDEMNCPYAYYDKDKIRNIDTIFCEKQNGKWCVFSKFCKTLNKMIPNDSLGYTMEDCVLRYEVDIPKGSSRVRKSVSDSKYLYVDIEINGELYTHKIKNPYPKKEIPDYVYVQEGLGGYEIVEKPTTKKTTRK